MEHKIYDNLINDLKPLTFDDDVTSHHVRLDDMVRSVVTGGDVNPNHRTLRWLTDCVIIIDQLEDHDVIPWILIGDRKFLWSLQNICTVIISCKISKTTHAISVKRRPTMVRPTTRDTVHHFNWWSYSKSTTSRQVSSS